MNRNIEDEVKRTIESIDDIQRAEAPPFLQTRVRAQIQPRKQQSSPLLFLLLKPALSFVVLFVTMALNIYMLLQVMNENKTDTVNKNSSIQVFAKEYGMVSYSAYDK